MNSWHLNRRSTLQLGMLAAALPRKALASGLQPNFWVALVATLTDTVREGSQTHLVAEDAARILATTHPDAVRRQLAGGFQLLRFWGYFSGYFAPFESLSDAERILVAQSWFSSRIALTRTLATVAKNLVLISWYDRCESWQSIGYDGPLLGAWERRPDGSVICPVEPNHG